MALCCVAGGRRLLRESPRDGLYRPTLEVWEELRSTLVPVEARPVAVQGGRASGVPPLPAYQLLTPRSRILETELVG